jgi:hypothetical protein
MADTKIETKNEFEVEAQEMDDIAASAREEIDIESGKKPKEDKPKEEIKEAPKDIEKKEDKTEEVEETEEQKSIKSKEEEEKEKIKAVKEAAKKKDDEDALIALDDKDLDEEKRYKKIAIIKIRDDEKKKIETEAVKSFADKHKLPVEKAKEELEHISKIKEKYKDDDRELPLAYLNIQRQNTKLSEDLKKIQESAPIKSIEKATDEDILRDVVDSGKITIKGKPGTRVQIVEAYRLSHPGMEEVNDDTVLSLVANQIRQGLIHQRSTQMQEIKLQAKDRRIEIINSIEEKDKDFAETVKSVVENTSDEALLSPSFSVQDVIRWAKGEKYDELISKQADEIKKAHDEGFRKGKENAKILGIKTSETPAEGKKVSKVVTLSESEKDEARQMFDIPSMTDEEKFKEFSEVMQSRKKENKK